MRFAGGCLTPRRITAALAILACLCCFQLFVRAQQPVNQTPAGAPVKENLPNGGYREITKNAQGERIQEDEYNGLGVKTKTKKILSRWPNGQEAEVEITSFGARFGAGGAVTKVQHIKYDKNGNPTEIVTYSDYDNNGVPQTKTTTTWPPGSGKDGQTKTQKWVPGPPGGGQWADVSACAGSDCATPACVGADCQSACTGANCAPGTCTGPNCASSTTCTGPSCGQATCSGPGCTTTTCTGPNCPPTTCVGADCQSACTGANCAPGTCTGPGCTTGQAPAQAVGAIAKELRNYANAWDVRAKKIESFLQKSGAKLTPQQQEAYRGIADFAALNASGLVQVANNVESGGAAIGAPIPSPDNKIRPFHLEAGDARNKRPDAEQKTPPITGEEEKPGDNTIGRDAGWRGQGLKSPNAFGWALSSAYYAQLGALAYSGAQNISDPKQKQIWLDNAGLYFSEAALRYGIALGIPPFEGVADQVKPTGDLILPGLLYATQERSKDTKAGAEAQPAAGAAAAGSTNAAQQPPSITQTVNENRPLPPQVPCQPKEQCDKLCDEARRAEKEARAAKDAAQAAETQQQKDLAKADQLEREAYQQQFNKDNRISENLEIAYAKRAQAKALRDNSAAAVAKAKADAEAKAKAAAAARAACDACQPCPEPDRTGLKAGTDAKPKQPEKKPTGGQTPQEGKAVGKGTGAAAAGGTATTPGAGSNAGAHAGFYDELGVFHPPGPPGAGSYYLDWVIYKMFESWIEPLPRLTETEKGYDATPNPKDELKDKPNYKIFIGGGPGTTWQLLGPTPCPEVWPVGTFYLPQGTVCLDPQGRVGFLSKSDLPDPKTFAGLGIARKVYVPKEGYFARYLEILSSPTGAVGAGTKTGSETGATGGAGAIVTPAGDECPCPECSVAEQLIKLNAQPADIQNAIVACNKCREDCHNRKHSASQTPGFAVGQTPTAPKIVPTEPGRVALGGKAGVATATGTSTGGAGTVGAAGREAVWIFRDGDHLWGPLGDPSAASGAFSPIADPNQNAFTVYTVGDTGPQNSPEVPDGISIVTGGLRPPPASWSRQDNGSFRPVAFRSGDSLTTTLAPGTVVRVPAPETSTPSASGEISFSIVANGNSMGEAFELQVLDPTGKVKKIAMPEGVVLQPLKPGSAKPVATRAGGNVLTKKLYAYCLDFAKLSPEPGQLYRIAPQALQEKFKPLRAVLQGGRQLAAAGQLHPDSDPKAYVDSIRQYALWTKLENWDMQKFGEMFVQRTKKNAEALNVKWTKEMENALRGVVPGRWRDISAVLEQAKGIAQAAPQAARPVQ